MVRTEAPAESESRRKTATPQTYSRAHLSPTLPARSCRGPASARSLPPWSIRVRPSSVISECVSNAVQSQLAAIIETIPVTISPEISQGEIVSHCLICSVRVSNKPLFSFRKWRISLSMIRRASLAMAVKSVLKLSNWDAIESA